MDAWLIITIGFKVNQYVTGKWLLPFPESFNNKFLLGFEKQGEILSPISVKCTNEKNECHKSKSAFVRQFRRLWITCGWFVEL
jgi:hypothetical protein